MIGPTSYTRPTALVEIAGKLTADVVEAVVRGSRVHPMGVAEVHLRPGLEVSTGDEIHIYMGVDDTQYHVFSGQVTEAGGSNALVVKAEDAVGRLRQSVSKAFRACTPREIAKALASELGLEILVPVTAPARHSWVCQGPVLKSLQLAAAAWGLNWDIYAEPERQIYWGPLESAPRYTSEPTDLEAGLNLMSSEVQDSVINLVTVFNPFIGHSERVRVTDPSLGIDDWECVVDRVVHRYADCVSEVSCRQIL